MIIRVKARITDNFGDPISEVVRIMDLLAKANRLEEIIIDFSNCVFSTPFLLVAISILFRQYQQNGYKISLNTNSENRGFNEYLSYIHFADGLKPDEIEEGNYQTVLDQYRNKTYIPLINFPASRSGNTSPVRDKFLSVLNDLFKVQLGLTGNIKIAVSYLIDEAIANIVDHSREQRGFIFAQYYPNKNFMDVCLADNGISILGSYAENGYTEITTDEAAIQSAVNGKSTKFEDESRGFGIRTSKKMLVNGLKGIYFLLSGNAFLINSVIQEEIITLPSPLKWKGTILALRIPTINNADFNPSSYYEG